MINRKTTWLLGLILILVYFATINSPLVSGQSDEYIGAEACKTCHQDNYDEWQESKHSEAYSDPEFQEAWIEGGSQNECLQCHTTGYDQDNEEYAFEGVTCEACHDAGLSMTLDRSSELCGTCHTGEYGNYRYEQYLEGTHKFSDVTCADCHVSEEDHSFEFQSKTCATCHTEERIHSSNLITDMQTRALLAEDQLSVAQEEHDNLVRELSEVEKRTEFVTQLMFFGVGGLILVTLIVAVYYLRQRQS